MSWGIVNSDDGPLLLAIGRNISERLESESRLRRQSEQQAAVAALGERALRGVEPSELAREAAERVREVLGADRVEVLEGPREIAAWGALGRSASSVSVPIHTGDRVHGALVATSPDEEAFGDEEGSFLQAIANVLAVGFSRLNLEEQMRQQALHDSLTGLANRTLCRDRILHALARLRARGVQRRRPVRRRRQLQARQRHVRPRGGRPAADRARRADGRRRAARRHRRPARRRRVRGRLRVGRRADRARARLARGRRGPGADHGGGQRAPARGEHRDRARQRRGQRPRRADRPRRRRRLPREGARHRAGRAVRRGPAPARGRAAADRERPRGRARARASSSSSSSRSSRSRTTTARSRTRRCCAGSASARRSARPSSSRSPRSRA